MSNGTIKSPFPSRRSLHGNDNLPNNTVESLFPSRRSLHGADSLTEKLATEEPAKKEPLFPSRRSIHGTDTLSKKHTSDFTDDFSFPQEDLTETNISQTTRLAEPWEASPLETLPTNPETPGYTEKENITSPRDDWDEIMKGPVEFEEDFKRHSGKVELVLWTVLLVLSVLAGYLWFTDGGFIADMINKGRAPEVSVVEESGELPDLDDVMSDPETGVALGKNFNYEDGLTVRADLLKEDKQGTTLSVSIINNTDKDVPLDQTILGVIDSKSEAIPFSVSEDSFPTLTPGEVFSFDMLLGTAPGTPFVVSWAEGALSERPSARMFN